MSRTAATLSPGNANRRFLLLAVTLGLLGAILVYAAFSRGSGSGGGAAANTPVVVAKADIPARTKITASMIEVRLVPPADASELAFRDVNEAVGQVTRYPLVANEQVLSSKVVPLAGTGSTARIPSRALSFVVPEGMRGFAISVSEVQNGGGLVLPGDYVDVIVIYDVEFSKPGESSRSKEDAYLVQTILQNVEVLAVSQETVDVVAGETATAGGQRVRNSEGKADPEAKTVTLAVTPDQVQRLYLAEGNGRIRLAVRPYGDSTQQPIDYMTELDLFPRNLPNPFLR